jgi:antitoxin component HigA of HigAB toxin-antitoxin module
MTLTQAKRKLRTEAERLGGQKYLAKAIGCSDAMLSRVLLGQKSFGADFAKVIQKKFKVPKEVWGS